MPELFEAPSSAGFARVAVERGVDRFPEGLTYAVPGDLADLAPGERVLVPLGKADAPTVGYVVERVAEPGIDAGRIKPIARRARGPRLPGQLLALARWISGYYCAPIGTTLAAITPAAVKRQVGTVSRTLVDTAGPDHPETRIPPGQRRVLEVLRGLPPGERPVDLRRLADLAGLRTIGPLRRMVEKGLLAATSRTAVEAAWIDRAIDRTVPESLTPEQQVVVDALGPELPRGFSTHLLFGVTGSGKTEVYIRLIERVVAAGRVAIMLVPEIGLTPQTGGRLIGRFPRHRVALLHSGLTAAQRHQQWTMVAEGAADIVLGARSAVFAPVADGRLGLIVVDEEHDASYKQDQAPRYHGRDVAVRRGQIAGCLVLLGSATPSMESWHNATVRCAYGLHRLERRVPGLRLPRVQVVDFAAECRRHADRRVHLVGPTMEAALRETLEAGGQALVMLNRRGYANYIACSDRRCGWMFFCDDCDAMMVYHLERALPSGGYVECHHCGSRQTLPPACPNCGKKVTTFGLGTQRVEEELARKFPQLAEGRSMLRVDSDSMHGARDFHRALGRFGSGEVRVLLGTQMIAKGLDFPQVRMVGVVNADTAVNLPDFRATERTYQLVSQVAGRCGRGADPGRVIVQTFQPASPAIQLAAAHDYQTFATRELADRERLLLPPYTRMARIVVRHKDFARCREAAQRVADGLAGPGMPRARLRGPAPCPIARIAGRHRQQIEILARSAAELQELLTEARRRGMLHNVETTAVDVDPMALL
jgi:primosomal protein N' (replication factor Y)